MESQRAGRRCDWPCITACEPGTLRPLPRSEVAMGTTVIRLTDCYLAQNQPCDYCVSRCPIGPDAVGFGSDRMPEVNRLGCSGCGVCAYLRLARAIVIGPRQDEPQATASRLSNSTTEKELHHEHIGD